MSGEKINRKKTSQKFSFANLFWATRPVNILIVVLTQLIFYHLLFVKHANDLGLHLALKGDLLFLFLLTTAIITVCGYLINDYIDFESDILNKKHHRFHKKSEYLPAYFTFLFIGLGLALFIANQLDKPKYALFYHLASAILFLYSTHFKKKILSGNFIVALFTASVLLVFLLFESQFIISFEDHSPILFASFQMTLYFYCVFIFLINFIREMIKDLEDIEGDKISGDKTLAVINVTFSKNIIIMLSILLIAIEILFLTNLKTEWILALGIALILFPQVFLIYTFSKAKVKTEFNQSSKIAKANMFLGLLFLIISSYKF